MNAAQYLRKSRMEEGMETEEVLARHRSALAEFALKHNICIVATYCEVVSGESLYARPQMLRLLEDVETGSYDAVLCMDLDRLSRGRMKDQGLILDTFRDSGTLIITPEKTYDLSDEIDDELAEFKTFMSRREYKIINKRLRRGLKQSIQDGCYVANAPYGYRRAYAEKKPTLEIWEPEAQYVRMMYRMYAQGYGCTSIAHELNLLGARPHRSDQFSRNAVAAILRNPTYIGKIVWDQKKHIRKGSQEHAGKITVRQPREQWTITDGIHPPIVAETLYDRVQEIFSGRYLPSKQDGTIKSPLAGLIRCSVCGKKMQRISFSKGGAYLVCATKGCCAAAKYELVENRIFQHLRDVLMGLTAEEAIHSSPPSNLPWVEETCLAVRREKSSAEHQVIRLHELLELGEYDLPTFRARMAAVQDKLSKLTDKEAQLRTSLASPRLSGSSAAGQTRKIATALDAYELADPAQRNALLHAVIHEVRYTKAKKSKPAEFRLEIELNPF